MPDTVPVVAAVIERGSRYLVGRRPPHKRHGGMWEFPGGKMRDGEDHLGAVDRELREELDMKAVEVHTPLWERRDPGSPFVIVFVPTVARGEARPTEHTEVGWFSADELRGMPLAPTDARFVEEVLPGSAADG